MDNPGLTSILELYNNTLVLMRNATYSFFIPIFSFCLVVRVLLAIEQYQIHPANTQAMYYLQLSETEFMQTKVRNGSYWLTSLKSSVPSQVQLGMVL